MVLSCSITLIRLPLIKAASVRVLYGFICTLQGDTFRKPISNHTFNLLIYYFHMGPGVPTILNGLKTIMITMTIVFEIGSQLFSPGCPQLGWP